MEEKVKIGILLDMYGVLLTSKQRNFMELYYNEDWSLSEIAESNKITRQAVRAVLLKAKKKLEKYEEQLNFMKKQKIIKKCVEQLRELKVKKEVFDKIEKQLDF